MSDGSERRRLKMMPEVLPAPPSRGAEPSAPRARALEHMQKLLAGATATAALVGCSSEDPSVRPEPSATGATTGAPTASSPSDAASASASATAEPTAEPSASAEAVASASASASASSQPGGSGFAGGTATIPIKRQPPPPPPPTGYMVVDPMPPPVRRP